MYRQAGRFRRRPGGMLVPSNSTRSPPSGVVVLFSGLAERLRKQVEEADPNLDFASWLHTDENVAALGWNVKDVVTYVKDVDLAERKAWRLEVLEGMKQHFLEREHAQQARNARHDQALMVQRSLPGSNEALDKILRYETTIERQLLRAITELEKLQAARRRTSSPASGPTRAA
jgi:hypothetical protein